MTVNQDTWTAVDNYFTNLLAPSDSALDRTLQASDVAGLPSHQVTANQGKLLQILAQMQGARNILEIGTLGGYSTIWLARALPPDGRVVTLEVNPQHGAIATQNIAQANLSDQVEIRIGSATDSLAALVAEQAGPFDLIFIDADKPNNPVYFDWSLKLSRPGTVIVGDNVVRDGAVVDSNSADPKVQGVRRFCELIAADSRLSATAIQTVGSKGYDGFAIARVNAL
ncbi:MAG: O-methyltransferase [Cyanothece sp. SIO2G6]|nr:O-methyltransferase [Cyanothece sp. SIO2G6]